MFSLGACLEKMTKIQPPALTKPLCLAIHLVLCHISTALLTPLDRAKGFLLL